MKSHEPHRPFHRFEVHRPMPGTVFISYCHQEGDWVWDRLVPVLKAGDAEVLFDREQFEAGRALKAQEAEVQNRADLNVLVFSPGYLASRPCQGELRRARKRDPDGDKGVVVPVLRAECTLPSAFRWPGTLYVDLRNDQQPEPWGLLLTKCGLTLGTTAPEWFRARDDVRRHLSRGESVNLVVGSGVHWKPLIEDLRREPSLADLGVVDLENPETASRPGLVGVILRACGATVPVPEKPNDLVELGRILTSRRLTRIALTHFDWAAQRPQYEPDLFAALRYLMMESRKLVLLIQSRTPFSALMPRDHPMSAIDLKTVELKGRA